MTSSKIILYSVSFLFALPLACTDAEASSGKTLYEKVAFSPLVVHGTTISDDAKYAEIHVLEVLKGTFQGEMFHVSFRIENFERQRGEEKIIFDRGEEAILLLEPVLDRASRIKDDSLFRLIGGAEGKIELSPESGQPLIDAAKRFIEIQSLDSQNKIWKEHKKLLQEKNRFLIQAGFQEIIKFRIADWLLIPTLLPFLIGYDVEFQIHTAKIMTQLFQDERKAEEEKEGREEVIRSLIQRARGDRDPRVRVEAIRALSAAGAEDYQDIFKTISEHDESQDVRYEAQKVLYEIRTGKKYQ